MLKRLQYVFCAVFGTIICLWGFALWQMDREEERTVNLVKQESHRYRNACELHGTTLQWDRVRIGYGLVVNGPNDSQLFPYSNKWVSGGCLGGGPRYGLILFCQQCREAEAAFRKIEAKQDPD